LAENFSRLRRLMDGILNYSSMGLAVIPTARK
jgi:hypothetical protein